ncbi:MAG: NACHT domain-containing protein, partial [Bryobacteraceae bacterium]
MQDDPTQKPLVGQIDAHDGARVVVAGAIVGDVYIGNKPAGSLDQRNRLAMLERVRSDWIDGVLKQSLYKVARIELGLEAKDDAVELPLNAIVQVPDRAPTVIPPGTGIVDIFDKLGQALLILGAPGTGKTTLLLELAGALLDRAFKDESHPIPVVFNLSSWALKREPLAKWLVSELNLRSFVPKKIGQRWVGEDHVLPLLDGLDEVDATHRRACADAINQFSVEHGLLPIAICSRSADFDVLARKLRVRGAVEVQPLTREQIDCYLERSTELLPLQAAIGVDPSLAELLASPLMLWVAMLAYRDSPVHIDKAEDLDHKRLHLLKTFVLAMFRRRAVESRYTERSTLHWLSRLASALQREQQTVFYLESLRPTWLPIYGYPWLSK